MKHKFSLMGRVAIALVLALSLSLVTAVPVSAAGAALTVTITQPATGSEIAVGGDFTVTAEVENTGTVKATDVTATIAITGDASTTDPLTLPATPIAELAVGASAEVFWTLTCDAEGTVTIEVTPAGKDFITGSPIPEVDLTPDTVAIEQMELVPILTADIIEPADGSNVSVGDEFTVTAVVINTGFAATTGDATKAAITITGDATLTTGATPQTIADLAIGGSAEATWTVTCNGVGAVTIDVAPAGEYGAATIIPEANLVPDSIGLTQQLPAALEVTAISAPANAKVGEEFDVIATVKNTGEATATGVTATVTPGTTLDVTGETIGTGDASETVFDFTLASPPVVAGTLTITDPVIDYTLSLMNWEKGTGTVTFVSAPPAAAILADYTGWEASTTEADIVGDLEVDLVDLAGDAETQVTFTFLSKALGNAFIKVVTVGTDANTTDAIAADDLQPNSAIVIQKEAAVLEVITLTAATEPFTVGDEITVTATVQNTGASTAQDVALTIAVDANAELKTGQVATQTVGYLAPADTSDIIWTLVCTAAGTSTITVSPSGIDVLTGVAIPAGSLIDKSVTVLQSVITYDITLQEGWNLVSLPLIPTDSDIDAVLAGADVTVNKAVYFTGGIEGVWQLYTPTLGDLTHMNAGKGYWIDVTLGVGTKLIATGVELALPGQSPPTYDVVVGWNMIGFTSTEEATLSAEAYLGPAVILTVEAMYRYNATTDLYEAITTLDTLEPGEGYWLAVNAAGKIYP